MEGSRLVGEHAALLAGQEGVTRGRVVGAQGELERVRRRLVASGLGLGLGRGRGLGFGFGWAGLVRGRLRGDV